MSRPVERAADKHFISVPRIHGKVEFREVVFKYPGQTYPALHHLNFAVEPGEHVGVIGAVGSGKTTIERLLLWEGSSVDGDGRFSPAILHCQVHDLWPPARTCGRVHHV